MAIPINEVIVLSLKNKSLKIMGSPSLYRVQINGSLPPPGRYYLNPMLVPDTEGDWHRRMFPNQSPANPAASRQSDAILAAQWKGLWWKLIAATKPPSQYPPPLTRVQREMGEFRDVPRPDNFANGAWFSMAGIESTSPHPEFDVTVHSQHFVKKYLAGLAMAPSRVWPGYAPGDPDVYGSYKRTTPTPVLVYQFPPNSSISVVQ